MFQTRDLLRLLGVGALALVLVACQSNLDGAGQGVEMTRLDAATADDFVSLAHEGPVEIFGAGMGNEFEVLANPAKLTLPDVGQIDEVLLQVILKWADPAAVVTFEDAATGGDVLATVTYADAKEFISGNYFEATLSGDMVPPSGEIWARVNSAGEPSAGSTVDFAPRSFVAFVAYADSMPNVTTLGGIGYADIFYDKIASEDRVGSYAETMVFASAMVDRPVAISFALSEVEDDDRVARIEVTVDGAVVFEESFAVSDEDEVIVRRIAATLPAGATTIVVKATSPDPDVDGVTGDSFFLAGATASVTEPDDEPPFGACTPGYWRNHAGAGPGPQANAWVGYAPSDAFSSVFARQITITRPPRLVIDDPTLLVAVQATGGGVNALARSAVASLLNAAHPDVHYPYTEAEVIAMVQEALDGGDVGGTATLLDDVNNQYSCPL